MKRTDRLPPNAHTPARGIANKDRVAVMLIISPIRPGSRYRRTITMMVAGMTTPNPVRSDMLSGRRIFGERLIKTRLKIRMDATMQQACQNTG